MCVYPCCQRACIRVTCAGPRAVPWQRHCDAHQCATQQQRTGRALAHEPQCLHASGMGAARARGRLAGWSLCPRAVPRPGGPPWLLGLGLVPPKSTVWRGLEMRSGLRADGVPPSASPHVGRPPPHGQQRAAPFATECTPGGHQARCSPLGSSGQRSRQTCPSTGTALGLAAARPALPPNRGWALAQVQPPHAPPRAGSPRPRPSRAPAR